MSLVELSQYQIPRNNPKYLQAQVISEGDAIFVDRIRVAAEDLGFRQNRYDNLVHGIRWQGWGKSPLTVPNFPEGETIVHARLALASPSEDPFRNAVLRLSKECIDPSEFNRDVASLTHRFMRRPLVWGFPSRLLMEEKYIWPAMLVGSVLGGAIGARVNLEGQTLDSASIFAFLGVLTTVFGGPTLGRLAEKWALRQISHTEQYFAGAAAQEAIFDLSTYTTTALLQREFYRALKQQHPDLDPETFLKKVYRNMPRPIMAQRLAEDLEFGRVKKGGSALTQLVEVGNILLAVE